jgi:beta-lactamase superfamily II metal-dependent hydrolase
MRLRWSYALALALLPAASGAAPTKGTLDFYFVDVEGGAATLIVTPAGESVLIDCGAPGDRDASRIAAAAKAAGLKRIDHLIATHWHSDHFGGTPDLVKRIPVGHFYNRGVTEKGDEGALFEKMMAAYKQCSTGKSTTLKAGDWLPLHSTSGSPVVKILTLCGSKQFLPDKPGAPKNPMAQQFLPQAPDPSDNAQSLGFLVSFGGFKFVDLGDLTWNMEEKLVDPTDKVGPIDVFQTTHHGLEISNNDVLIKTMNPRVAVFNNGPRKGGHPDVTMTLRQLPEIKAIYQLHKNLTSMESDNTTPNRIANTADTPDCKGEFIKMSVAADGKSYTVQVGPNGKREKFATRK